MSMVNPEVPCQIQHFEGEGFAGVAERISPHSRWFEARPAGPQPDFRWSADLSRAGVVTLVSATCGGGWELLPAGASTELVALMRLRGGRVDLVDGDRRIEGAPGSLLLSDLREGAGFSMVGNANVCDTLLLDRKRIVRAIAERFEQPVHGNLGFLPRLDGSHSSGGTIANLVDVICECMKPGGLLQQSPLALHNLVDSLVDILVRHVPHNYATDLGRKAEAIAPRPVRQAIEFMRENIGRHITAERVAETVGVSSRSLQMAFQSFEGTTPAAYLRKIRIEEARKELLDPLSLLAIKEICLKWGFFHIGRFSDTYRKAYGETPSETRKRVGAAGREAGDGARQ